MSKYYFLSRYEIDCLERTLEELARLYPLVPIAQVEADIAEIGGVIEELPE